jgi:hypothetical protein
MLQHFRSISAGSPAWTNFTNVASRHTIQPLEDLIKYDGLGSTFSYANP